MEHPEHQNPKWFAAFMKEFARRTERLNERTAQLQELARQEDAETAEYVRLLAELKRLEGRIDAGELTAVDEFIALKRQFEEMGGK